jgi:DNA-binding LacI/PurR family transcriptional regulator
VGLEPGLDRSRHVPLTLEDVARQAGVSRATVSRVINNVSTVDPQLRQVVQRAIDESGYVPNRAARSLVTKRTGSVALVISEPADHDVDEAFFGRMFTDPFFGRVVSGALSALRPLGIHMVLLPAEDAAAKVQLLNYLRQGHVDGVILVSNGTTDPLPSQLAQIAVPSALSSRPEDGVDLSFVQLDQEHGGLLAAQELLARGAQRLATITGPLDMQVSRRRLAGFRTALTELDHGDLASVEGAFTRDSGKSAMARLLAEHPEVDGVFVASDLMAVGAIETLHEADLRVPEDVRVVGFDDSSAALASRPALTTVREPVEDMAAEMARMLVRQIEDPTVETETALFQPTLVRRDSA